MNHMLAPLVLVPGRLCDAALWRPQVEGLADRVAVSIPDVTLDDTIAGIAARTLAAAPSRFSLAGLSMGGYVAFEIMRQAPERVIRLTLLDTTAATDPPERIEERRRGLDSLKLGRFLGVTERMLPQLVHLDHVGGPVGETVMAMAGRVGEAAFVRQQHAILSRLDSRPTLASITVPTLIGVGDSDQLTPVAEAEQMHRGIVGSRLHIFERCGHLPTLEAPQETTALLRNWLDW